MATDMVYEDVPRLKRRTGDTVLAGGNNSALLLGRDRVDGVTSGHGSDKGSGSAHLVVGRKGEDLSFSEDSATVYASMKNDPDLVASTQGIGTESKSVSAIGMRADCVRVTARRDLKISVGSAYMMISSDGRITLDARISLGEGATDRLLKADAFSTFWNSLVIPTPAGPSGPPPPLPPSVFSSRPVLVK